MVLTGRRREREYLNDLIEGVRSGHSAAVVLRGDMGVGKTALLEDLIQSAADFRVARAVGVESEMELAFAMLQQLVAPMLGHLDRLPAPQSDALATVFGRKSGPAPDSLLAGLALLSLLSDAAEEHPLVCVVDDAQWMDRASAVALGVAARRLMAESVLLVIAARESNDDFIGLPELVVEGLPDPDSRELLDSAISWPLDDRVREQILSEARGNPLALLELPRGLSAVELAGGYGLPDIPPLAGRIEDSFLRRVERLPDDTRLLLTVAAAEPLGDSALLWHAAKLIGVNIDAADHPDVAGLVDIGPRVVFRHPLVRSVVYRASPLSHRQNVHAALAEVTDAEVDPDRRAWHRAKATFGPDEEVASELECSAGRAQELGGLAAAAAFLERSVELTADPALKTQRALAAARAKHESGAQDAALRLISLARSGPIGALDRAKADLLRAQIAYAQNRGSNSPRLLLKAVNGLVPLDANLAREACLDALWAALFAGRLAREGGLQEVAQAALALPPPAREPRASDLLLKGLATAAVGGYAAAAPILKLAVSAFRGKQISHDEELRWLWHAGVVAWILFDDASCDVLTARHVALARDAGALRVLPFALTVRLSAYTKFGQLVPAIQALEELRTLSEAIGTPPPPYGPVLVAAWQGRETEALRLMDEALQLVQQTGEGLGVAVTQYARAVLFNGLCQYEEAFEAATAADLPDAEGLAMSSTVMAEIVEAAARIGRPEEAARALQQIAEMAHASGTDWIVGMEARSRALVIDGNDAEPLYKHAIERLDRTCVRGELARAHLLYGEWLRRQNRRVDARQQLRQAHEMLTSMGIGAYSERARRELLATGEKVRARSVEMSSKLTAQEAQIALLAGEGRTNPEIGVHMFISTRTVEWHLRKVFIKLDLSSRRELRKALPQLEQLVLQS